MAGAAGPAAGQGPPLPVGQRIAINNPPTPAGFIQDPRNYLLNSRVGISRNVRVLRTTRLDQLARDHVRTEAARLRSEARRLPPRIAAHSNYTTRSGHWENENPGVGAAAAQQTATAAGRWGVDTFTDVDDRNAFTPQVRAAYAAAFPGMTIRNINTHVLDLTPEDLQGFYIRGNYDNRAGVIATDAQGNPVLIWSWFSRVLANVAWGMINTFGFPQGSFWQVQVIDGNGTELSHYLSFDPPTLNTLRDAIANLDDDETSDGKQGEAFTQGSLVRLLVYNPSTGAGGGPLPPHLRSKAGTVWNPPGDEFCAPKAIVVALAEGSQRKNLKARPAALAQAIDPLLENVSGDASWGFLEIGKAAAFLKIRISVLSVITFALLLDTGEVEGVDDEDDDDDTLPTPHIYLLHDQVHRHYLACFNPSSLDSNRTWCAECRKLYWTNRPHHHSAFACKFCGANHDTKAEFMLHFYGACDEDGEAVEHVTCAVCNKRMPPSCCEVHQPKCKGHSVRCSFCNEVYLNADKVKSAYALTEAAHLAICGEGRRYCVNCDSHEPRDHQCLITRKDFAHDFSKPPKLHVVFDMETMRDDSEAGRQIVTLVSVREVPEILEGESKEEYTARHRTFHIDHPPLLFHTLRAFCEWAVVQKNLIGVAHNMKGFDGFLMNNELLYGLGVKTEVILVGLKVMSIRWGSCMILDSMNHMLAGLDSLPRIVGLDIPGLHKTHFPHALNTPENRDYRGPLPDKKFYDLPNSRERPADFDAWYESEAALYDTPEHPWVLKEVEETYCNQDTLVLAMCWGEYRRLNIMTHGVDPARCVTLASLCLRVYRHAHIPEEGIVTLTEEQEAFCRKALKGGRTEGGIPYYKGPIRGIDVQSMYPAVQWYDDMPTGAPEVFHDPDIPADWLEWCGIVELDIDPPPFDPDRPGFKPVIGGVTDGKFQFDLYPKTHTTITILEARDCVAAGYTVRRVHTVYKFVPSKGLFRSYIAQFLKIKVESSDPPEDIATCIREHKERYGIDLDPVLLAQPRNDGMRLIAKTFLNGLWGKLAQRTHPTQELVLPETYHKIVARHLRGEVELRGVAVDPFLDDAFGMTYVEKTRKGDMTRLKTNVAIGAHVTAGGRHRLYQVLGDPKYERRALYWDTDCVWYATEEGEGPHPLEGCYLGDWESEAPPGVEFNEMVILAPKLYAVRDTRQPDNPKANKVKCKGFKLTNAARSLITFDSLRLSQCEDEEGMYPPIVIPYTDFRRQPRGGIFVGPSSKVITFNPTTLKSKFMGSDEWFIPYGPHTERPELRFQKRPPPGPDEHPPLPPPKHPRRRLRTVKEAILEDFACEAGEDEELTENQAESLMASAIALQDQSRTPFLLTEAVDMELT